MLNLKDLLAVVQSSLKRLYEDASILRALFWCRNVPNSVILCQNTAEYGTKATFLVTHFLRMGKVRRLGSHRNERSANRPLGRKHHRRGAPICGRRVHRISKAGSLLVTDVVELIKLIGGIVANFPLAFCHFGVKALLQTNGLLGLVSVFGRFWGYQIVPNFTIFDQKRAAKGREQPVKGQLTGFFCGRFY